MKVETQVTIPHTELVTILTEIARKATGVAIGGSTVTFTRVGDTAELLATVSLQTKEKSKP